MWPGTQGGEEELELNSILFNLRPEFSISSHVYPFIPPTIHHQFIQQKVLSAYHEPGIVPGTVQIEI